MKDELSTLKKNARKKREGNSMEKQRRKKVKHEINYFLIKKH